jgi:hypothetical protein
MPARVFIRLPVLDSIEDALTWGERLGAVSLALHARPGGDVVGAAELPAEDAEAAK